MEVDTYIPYIACMIHACICIYICEHIHNKSFRKKEKEKEKKLKEKN